MVFHSSRIARSRSPAAFHCVELAASSSASAASASLRAVWAARCSSRRERSAATAASACSAMLASRAASASMSPSTVAVGSASASSEACALILRASPVPDASRSSIRVTSVARSSNRRPKWANAASRSPACQEPTTRSPAALISHTVPSSSTRPNRCGSLGGGGTTTGWAAGRPALTGRGPGRGPGRGAGRAESSRGWSPVMRSSLHLSHRPRGSVSRAPAARGGTVSCSRG